MSSSLIAPDSLFGILATLTLVGALALWLEGRGIGRRLSGVVMGILGGMLCSNLGILPFDSPIYDFIWSSALPFGLVLLLLHADLRRIFRETGRLMLGFLAGAVGTIVGALAAFGAFSSVIPHAGELSGIFAASYIGGSINFLATSKVLGMDAYPDIQAGAMAADNLVMAAYFVLLFSLPEFPPLARRYAARVAGRVNDPPASPTMPANEGPLRPVDLLTTLALGASICLAGEWLAALTPIAGAQILWVTVLTVALATLASKPLARVRGVQPFGLAIMQLFFVMIGAAASIAAVIRIGPVVVLFLTVLIGVHLLFLLTAGWILRLDLREIAGASNANCGGPTTAAAMALAKGWDGLVVPLILCGTFGYAIANFIGAALGGWLAGIA